MDDVIFTARWEEWLAMPGDLGVWPGSDPNLLRPRLEELCRFYLEGSTEQRRRLVQLFQSPTPTGNSSRPYNWFDNLCDYAAYRIAEIRLPSDVTPLYFAIAALVLLPDYADHRDEWLTMSRLHDVALNVGIDPAPYFKEILAGATARKQASMRWYLTPDTRLAVDIYGDRRRKIHPKTANLREVLDQARVEAQRLRSPAVGTGHLTLGLLRFGVVAAILRELGVDPSTVRVAIEAGLRSNSDPDDRTATSEEWGRTPRAREVWELAFGALEGAYWVGPDSVLLGILRQGTNLAAEALHSVGVTSYDQARTATVKVIDEQGIAYALYDPYKR